MKKILNECVDCGLPCKGNACPYRNVTHYYCDKCGAEETLYHYEDKELCIECLSQRFAIVEGSND